MSRNCSKDANCKPNFSDIINGQTGPSTQEQKTTFDAESIVGLVIWFCCVLYSSIRTASNKQTERLIGSDKVLAKTDDGSTGTLGSLILVVFLTSHHNK